MREKLTAERGGVSWWMGAGVFSGAETGTPTADADRDDIVFSLCCFRLQLYYNSYHDDTNVNSPYFLV
jgi:hypothetical protein